ncbi:tetratricopeptide repeat protein [Myxococcota bacterium]|nr:tetratricopeptide repeat protein [Myxococcota bacterium]
MSESGATTPDHQPPKPNAGAALRVTLVRADTIYAFSCWSRAQLAEALSESAAIRALVVRFSAIPTPGDGLYGTFCRALGVEGARGEPLVEALRERLGALGLTGEGEAEALAAAFWPMPGSFAPEGEERAAISRRLLSAFAAESRLLLFVGRAEQAQEVVQLLEDWSHDEGLPQGLELVMWFAPLVVSPGVERLLSVEGELSMQEVHERLTAAGAVVRRVTLPETNPALREDAIRRALSVRAALNDEERASFDRFMVLDQSVTAQEWALISGGVVPLPEHSGLGALLAADDISPHEGTWTLRWPEAREALLQVLRDEGSMERRSAEVAAMLVERYGPVLDARRVALHLLNAKDEVGALHALTAAIAMAREAGHLDVASALVARAGQLVDILGLHDNDPHRLAVKLERVRLLRQRGRLDEALRLGETAVACAGRAEDPELLAHALRALGQVAYEASALDRAESLLRSAEERFRALGSAAGVADCLHDRAAVAGRRGQESVSEALFEEALTHEVHLGRPRRHALTLSLLGRARRQQGRVKEALQAFSASARIAREASYRYGLAVSLRGEAVARWGLGQLDEAKRLVRSAEALMVLVGRRDGLALCHNTLGDILRASGDVEQAEQAYLRALRVMESIRSPETITPRLNLALLYVDLGDMVRARPLVEGVRAQAASRGRAGVLAAAHMLLMAMAVSERDADAVDAQYERATALLAQSRLAEPDIAYTAQLAGDRAYAQELPRLRAMAPRLWEIALEQRVALKDADGVRALGARLREAAAAGMPVPLGGLDLTGSVGSEDGVTGWGARDRRTGVALIVASPTQTNAARWRAWREDRAKALKTLHPNLVTLLDAGVVSRAAAEMTADLPGRSLPLGAPWTAVEMTQGQLFRYAPLEPTRWARAARGALSALAAIHGAGGVFGAVKSCRLHLALVEGEPDLVRWFDLCPSRAKGPNAQQDELRALGEMMRAWGPPPTEGWERWRAALEAGEHPSAWAALLAAPDGGPPDPPPRGPSPWERWFGPGLALERLPRFVGRDEELALTLSRAEAVLRGRDTSALLISGSAGVGKARLVQELLAELSRRTGAWALRVDHSPVRPAALMEALRALVGVDSEHGGVALRARVERLIGAEGHREGALESIAAGLEESVEVPGRASILPRRARDAARDALIGLATRGPVIVVISAAEWGLQSLLTLEDTLLMTMRSPKPLLFVITTQTDLLAERPREAVALERLERLGWLIEVVLRPLEPAACAELAQSVVAVEPALLEQLNQRAAGHPAFMLELLRECVRRTPQVWTAAGLSLGPGAEVGLPDDHLSVWSGRVDRLVAGLPFGARVALQLAALLGPDVDDELWRDACVRLGVLIPEALTQRLFTDQLAESASQGWAFTHPGLREALLREAARDSRALHEACAAALLARREDGLRAATHLLRAGQPSLACPYLLRFIHGAIRGGSLQSAESALSLYLGALTSMGVSDSGPEWGGMLMLRARLAEARQEVDTLASPARRLLMHCYRHEWSEQMPTALRLMGVVLLRRRRFMEALELLSRARELAEGAHNPVDIVEVALSWVDAQLSSGEHAGALASAQRALGVAEESKKERLIVESGLAVARSLTALGRLEEGHDAVVDVCRAAVAAGLPGLQGRALLQRGEVLALGGQYGEAITTLQEAVDVLRGVDDSLAERRALLLKAWVLALLGQDELARLDLDAAARGGWRPWEAVDQLQLCVLNAALAAPGSLPRRAAWARLTRSLGRGPRVKGGPLLARLRERADPELGDWLDALGLLRPSA